MPVLCLAQLNRQVEATRDNKPQLSHLRESGAIEQDADVVMFVHREEFYQTNEEDRERVKGQADLLIRKQRNGPTGDIKLTWLHEFTRFENFQQPEYDEFNDFGPELVAGLSRPAAQRGPGSQTLGCLCLAASVTHFVASSKSNTFSSPALTSRRRSDCVL